MTTCLSVALLSKSVVWMGLKQGRDRGESPAQYFVTQQSYFMRIPAQNIKNTVRRGRHLIKAIMLSCFNKESLQQSCSMCASSDSRVVKTPWVLAQVGANGWIWAGRCGLCDTSADVTKWNSTTFLLLRNVWSHGRPGCTCGTLRGPDHILGTDGQPRVVSQCHFQF